MYSYIQDFHASRKNKIGASDISKLICHPERQIESLAAYTDDKGIRHPETALDLYYRKINNEISESSFPARMGLVLEPYAIYEFISDNFNNDIAQEFLRGYLLHKIEQDSLSQKAGRKICIDPLPYNTTPFRHNTEASTDYGVSHIDCIFDPSFLTGKWKTIEVKNKEIDITKPFNIQIKSANLYSVMARKKDQYKGYDLDLKGWQGLPLSTFFQVQYEKAIYDIDTTYVMLIFNTNSKHYWKINRNEKYQKQLIQLAIYMKKCIDTRTPPKDLLMNSKDIQALYPIIQEDFREAKDEELTAIIQTAKKYIEAKQQKNAWTQKEKQYEDTISIHLKDTQLLKGNINGMFLDLAKWKETGGAERVMGLKDILAREDGKTLERYLKRKGLITQDRKNRKPSIIIKEKYLEGWEDENNNIR